MSCTCMIENIAQNFCDIVKSLWSSPTYDVRAKRSLSIMSEYTELLAYEESEEEFNTQNHGRRKLHRGMHNFVPTNPFRATVRISKVNSPCEKDAIEEMALIVEKESPTSFPTTPFSRARIMSHSTDRTSYTMFAVRDRLRMEAQSSSRDEYSR